MRDVKRTLARPALVWNTLSVDRADLEDEIVVAGRTRLPLTTAHSKACPPCGGRKGLNPALTVAHAAANGGTAIDIASPLDPGAVAGAMAAERAEMVVTVAMGDRCQLPRLSPAEGGPIGERALALAVLALLARRTEFLVPLLGRGGVLASLGGGHGVLGCARSAVERVLASEGRWLERQQPTAQRSEYAATRSELSKCASKCIELIVIHRDLPVAGGSGA